MDDVQFLDDDNTFMYFDVQNLSIDHSLTLPEIDRYKDFIFSPNSLQQIYFKDSCDLKTISVIKDLITISEYVDDSRIEKFVLLNLSNEEKNKFLDDIYENPSTWQVPYELVDDSFSLIDIPTYRTMNTFINKTIDKDLSPIEQIMKVYDTVKLMDFDDNTVKCSLPEIIRNNKANSYGMNKLFSYILNILGYHTFNGETDKNNYVTLVSINDSKYNIDGIYLFDPSMDNLSRNDYSRESIRRINYNFFLCTLNAFSRLSYGEKPSGILSFLAIDDKDYSVEKVNNSKNSKLLKEKEKLSKSFGKDYSEIYDKIKESGRILSDTIVLINDVLYKDKSEKYNYLLKENYETRKKELFDKDSLEEIIEFVNEEKNK